MTGTDAARPVIISNQINFIYIAQYHNRIASAGFLLYSEHLP